MHPKLSVCFFLYFFFLLRFFCNPWRGKYPYDFSQPPCRSNKPNRGSPYSIRVWLDLTATFSVVWILCMHIGQSMNGFNFSRTHSLLPAHLLFLRVRDKGGSIQVVLTFACFLGLAAELTGLSPLFHTAGCLSSCT